MLSVKPAHPPAQDRQTTRIPRNQVSVALSSLKRHHVPPGVQHQRTPSVPMCNWSTALSVRGKQWECAGTGTALGSYWEHRPSILVAARHSQDVGEDLHLVLGLQDHAPVGALDFIHGGECD